MPTASSRGRWLAALLAASLATLALAVGSRELPAVRARLFLPTGGAEWLWAATARTEVAPLAFYVARDFELARPPGRALLLAAGDEEYVLHLNGKRVGAGFWRPGASLDAWEVGPLLLPGANRLVAELRSGRGAGGFLARLEDAGTGEPLLVTDRAFRLFRQHHLGLLRGFLPLELVPGGEPVFSWGIPPTGRWGTPTPGSPRPAWPWRSGPAPPLVAGTPLARAPSGEPLAPQTLFDFGREVAGHLVLEVRPGAERLAGLLFTGAAPPDPLRAPAAPVLAVAGRREWLDVRPRRFRYALVLGLPEVAGARLQPADPAAGRPFEAEGEERGVFGIVPPPLRAPVEDEVWRKLERVPGVAGREDR